MPHSKRSTASASLSIGAAQWSQHDQTQSTKLCCAIVLALCAAFVCASAQSVEDFYKGRQINLIIGGGAGGGYDVYYRTLARHMGRHIPGNPTFIAKNQPAAGGLAAASAIYTTAEKDGGTIGAFANNVTMDPLFGAVGARYDPLKLNWLGSIGKQQSVCATWHESPIKTDRAGAGARGDRRRRRRDLEHRADAEGAQRAARHQIPRDRRLRSRRRPDACRSSAARSRAFAGCHGRP